MQPVAPTTPVTPFESLFPFAMATYRVTGLAQLATLPGTQGDLASVDSLGNALFQYRAGWRQISEARVANAGALSTAYAAASGQYLVDGAQAILNTDPLTTLQYSSNPSPGAWYASRGRLAPYSEAAGTAATPAGGTVTVALPTNRFLVPPIVLATLGSYVANAQVLTDQITATGFRISTYNISTGAALAVPTIRWRAVEMTPTSADG